MEAFLAFARERGVDDSRVTSWKRGTNRILQVANTLPILPEHVAKSIELSEQGGAAPEALELLRKIGDLLVEFTNRRQSFAPPGPVSQRPLAYSKAPVGMTISHEGPRSGNHSSLTVKQWIIGLAAALTLIVGAIVVKQVYRYRTERNQTANVAGASAETSPQSQRIAVDAIEMTVTLPPYWTHDKSQDRSFQSGGHTVERGATFLRGTTQDSANAAIGVTVVDSPQTAMKRAQSDGELLGFARGWFSDYGRNISARGTHWACGGSEIVIVGERRAVRCRGVKEQMKQTGYLVPIKLGFAFFQLRANDTSLYEEEAQSLIGSIELLRPE